MTSRVLWKAVASLAIRRLLRLLAFAAVVLASFGARAQEVNLARLEDDAPNRVHMRTGAEYGFVAGVGYARTASVRDRRFLLTADLTLPWAGLDASDYRVRIGSLLPLVGTHHWRLAGTLAPTLRSTRNDIAQMTSVGTDIGLQGGYYASHWFVAGETGFDWAMTTHITHSDQYRQTVYAGARDGWYAMSGGNIRAGLQAGSSFSRYDLTVRVGRLVDVSGGSPMLPIYATLTLNTSW
jgi:hypothetical protein